MKKYIRNTAIALMTATALFSCDKFLEESPKDKYKRQNKMFHFHKTFCSKFSFINTKQNVHFIPFEYALNEIKASNTANS